MNILIIKTGALGDVVRSTFLAQALKNKYKDCNPKIFWLTSELAVDFFSNNSFVDHVVVEKDKDRLKEIYFDLIVNLEESEDLNKFVLDLNSKKILGYYYKNGEIVPSESSREWFDMSILGKSPQNDVLKKKNKKTHRQILAEISEVEDFERYEPSLRLTKKQRIFSNNFTKRHNLLKDDLVIGINAGGADRWPKALSVKKTADMIDSLYKKHNAKILLFGGPDEINRNNEILKLVKSPVISAGCGNDLVEFPALIAACNVMITTDSLGLHLALALKRKVVCLVGPTSPSELEMFGLGEKVIAKSSCVCCYNSDCKSMEKIDIKDVDVAVEKILKRKVTLIITAFKEPTTIGRSIEKAIKQKTKYEYDILVSAPDEETLSIAKEYAKKNKNVEVFKDPGKGKSFALNLIFKKLDSDILILTDGDVYISEESIEEMVNLFLNEDIGCVTGRPVPTENKNTKYGYWANFLFDAAHKLRKNAFFNGEFIECSGYLFAFRKKHIEEIPLDVAEDTVIPYYFWERGYGIGYAEKAEVYVKNVDNLNEWITQKVRTSKAHETLSKYVDINSTRRVKSFSNEARGLTMAIGYVKKLKEFSWMIQLIFARFYMWMRVFLDTKVLNTHYGDNWDRLESTK